MQITSSISANNMCSYRCLSNSSHTQSVNGSGTPSSMQTMISFEDNVHTEKLSCDDCSCFQCACGCHMEQKSKSITSLARNKLIESKHSNSIPGTPIHHTSLSQSRSADCVLNPSSLQYDIGGNNEAWWQVIGHSRGLYFKEF